MSEALPKILAVDYWPDNLMLIECALEDVAVEIIRANSGHEALAAAEKH